MNLTPEIVRWWAAHGTWFVAAPGFTPHLYLRVAAIRPQGEVEALAPLTEGLGRIYPWKRGTRKGLMLWQVQRQDQIRALARLVIPLLSPARQLKLVGLIGKTTRAAPPPRPWAVFGRMVGVMRRRVGLTQVELARRMGYQGDVIGWWEQGWRLPSAKNIQALATALNAPALITLREAWNGRRHKA